ncbi:hypothetical protein LX32DRAFT_706129 [Colletotrichum zoysiae]|uniref:Peptidase S8/S53 domain-containing protein n=1 Tax=Colletotrichum zoysiae TaxID=1216348 RepID=A0AAD9H823_9PEZI|nr:hypothetical protein LX32DRAFT_706129 [Colletotrichum zoysiae]
MDNISIDDDFGDLDNLIDDEPHPQILDYRTRSAEQSEEEKKWRGSDLELHDQCADVLQNLTSKRRRWELGTGPEDTPVLEEYKKEIIATRRESRDHSAPTALHILARLKGPFSEAPKDIQCQVVGHLLAHMDGGVRDAGTANTGKEDLFLLVALKYRNYDFIECVEKCRGEKFSALLHLQDGEGKNYIHHLFDLSDWKKKHSFDQKGVLRLVQELVPKALPETLATADKSGNTPLHYALDFRQCHNKPPEYVEAVKKMILAGDDAMKKKRTLFNKNQESPLIYSFNRVEEARQKKTASQSKNAAPATAQSLEEEIGSKNAATRLAVGPRSWNGPPVEKGDRPLRTVKGPVGIPKEPIAKEPTTREQMTKGPVAKAPAMKEPTKADPRTEGDRFPGGPADSAAKPTMSRANTAALITHLPLSQGERQIQSPTQAKAPPTASKVTLSKEINAEKGPESANSTNQEKDALRWRALTQIRDFITTHYIRTRPDMEARDLVFSKRNPLGKELNMNLFFDAREQQEARKIVDLLGRMSVGGFHGTLAYVYLPAIVHIPTGAPFAKPTAADRTRQAKNKNAMGREGLIQVFDKLYELKVRNILRLYVEDWQAPSHTDAAIEVALQGIDSLAIERKPEDRRPIAVETWDWRKPDLSIEVIAFAAPTVEHVNLYWSGNQAVLRAWNCKEGIPKLFASGKRLKTVIIHASPGLENPSRMVAMLSRFERDISKETNGKVKVKIDHRMDGLFTNMKAGEDTTDLTGDDPTKRQHAWVNAMDSFRKALSSFPSLKDTKAQRLKLALVDDGINLGNLDMYNGIVNVTGLSFCSQESGSERPWHFSSTGHGTILANMIVRVNPWVELYVIRVQDEASRSGAGRNIFARSAAKAIEAAVDLQVDIISMSWTIKNKAAGGAHAAPMGGGGGGVGGRAATATTGEAYDIRALERAIDLAAGKGILMFCSASDDIQAGAMDTLPYQKQPGAIFRIGAALPMGQRDPQSEDVRNIDYYFPGNQVAEAKNPRSAEPVKYHDGSSVGTALAAGLASLIIYCARLMEYHKAEKRERNGVRGSTPYASLAERLKHHRSMKQALDNIKSSKWEDPKYLPVWDVFGNRADWIKDALNEEEKWERLGKLVDQLGVGIED